MRMQVSQSHCLAYAERLSQCVVDLTGDFLNSAQLSPIVRV